MKKKDKVIIEGNKNLDEAVSLLQSLKKTKFVSSVDLDIVLNLKEKQKKESIRGSVDLPVKFGSDKKVVVLCDPSKKDDAIKAGAIDAGLEDLQKKIMDNKIEFDVVIATPEVMPKIVQLGKVLGPKGLMPNPKNGTITDNIAKAVASFKGGKLNFKMEQGHGVIRSKVAQMDMSEQDIKSNVLDFLKAVFAESKKLAANPFKKITLTTTMGGGIKLDVNDIITRIG